MICNSLIKLDSVYQEGYTLHTICLFVIMSISDQDESPFGLDLLKLDLYVILCNTYLSYFLLMSSAYKRLHISLDNPDLRTFLYEIKSFDITYEALKAFTLNSINKAKYPTPSRTIDYKIEYPRVENYEWLRDFTFPRSGLLSFIDEEVYWFMQDLNADNMVIQPHDYPRSPSKIFVDTLNKINEYMAHFIKKSLVSRETGAKIQKWLQWSQALSSLEPFHSQGFSFEPLHERDFDKLESRQYNQFVHFSPGALFVSMTIRVQDRIHEFTRHVISECSISTQKKWHKRLNTFELAIGSFISRNVTRSQDYLSITDPEQSSPFPYIHNLPLSPALSPTLPPGRRSCPVNPGFLFRFAFHRFVDAAGNYSSSIDNSPNPEETYETEHYDAIFALCEIFPYESFDDRANNFRKSVRHQNNTKKRSSSGESRSDTHTWIGHFDDMVFLLGPNVSKLLPSQHRSRSFGGILNSSHQSAN